MQIGITGRAKTIVSKENTASAVGSGTLDVFSTPAMIALMEQAAFESISDYLEEGQSTVGIVINAKHLRATPLDENVWAESKLLEIDRQRLVYSIQAYDAKGMIGEAHHERFIVSNERFMAKAKD